MANVTKEREAVFAETNTYKQGKAGGTAKKMGPAVGRTSMNGNGGMAGGVFRAARGPVKKGRQ